MATTAPDGKRPTILIVTMGADYIAPARMPRELAHAGFRVAMLAPREALAAHTRFIDRVGYFPANVKLHEWIGIVAGMARAVQPALILPGDDVTVRTLMQLVLDPPQGLRPEIRNELARLILRSMGQPAGWIDTIDKARLFETARRNSIAVAAGDVAASADEATAIADGIGYPVILRPAFGSAGRGIARCVSAADVRVAFAAPLADSAWQPRSVARVVVQKWIEGDVVNRASVAWQGREIAGVTRGRLATYPNSFGPASVVEFVGHPESTRATRALFALVGMHGLVGTQFIIEKSTGTAFLIEVNRRMLPATHAGALVGIDLAAALHAAATAQPWTGPDDLPPGAGQRLALFPQEWYRDPESAWLRTLPTDTPWDDPPLLDAMLKMTFAGTDNAALDAANAPMPLAVAAAD